VRRALVAADDRGTAEFLRVALKRWGLDMVIAHDGDAAWRAVQQDPGIAFAVLDGSMRGLPGLEVCRRIRRDATRAHLHVVLLADRATRDDVLSGLGAGADDYLCKPVDPEILRARVDVGLRVLALKEHLARQVAELESGLSRIRHLTGLLPLCSYCKHVRTDKNEWEQIEHYVAGHSDLQFSHAICPPCYDRVSAGIDDRVKNDPT